MGRARTVSSNSNIKISKNNYLSGLSTRNAVEVESEEEEESHVISKCSNSTNTFVPPYWSFVFSDMTLREYVCVTVNIPSGLCREQVGLDGLVDVQVSACRTKLLIACEWPESMTMSSCMENALSVRWKQRGNSKGGSCNQTGTVFNILHAFDLQLHKIRTQNLQSSSSNLGGTATIVLPFQVEPEMVVCETNIEETICSVNLYVVMKKVFKTKDKLVTNKMTVKVSNGMTKTNSNYGITSTSSLQKNPFVKQEKADYSSSGSSTLSNQPPRKSSRKSPSTQTQE
jgi:hypothetical protein